MVGTIIIRRRKKGANTISWHMESTRLKIIVQEQCAIIDALLGFVPKTIFQRSYQIPRFIFMSSAINVKIQFSGTLVKKLQTKTNFSTKSIELVPSSSELPT